MTNAELLPGFYQQGKVLHQISQGIEPRDCDSKSHKLSTEPQQIFHDSIEIHSYTCPFKLANKECRGGSRSVLWCPTNLRYQGALEPPNLETAGEGWGQARPPPLPLDTHTQTQERDTGVLHSVVNNFLAQHPYAVKERLP